MKKESKVIIKVLRILSSILLGGVILKVLIPYMYSLIMYILGLGINIFNGLILGISVASIVGVLSIVTQSIKRKSVYENDDYEMIDNSDYMRSQLYVIKGNEKKENYVKVCEKTKYMYSFDNQYRDNTSYDDVVIDDIIEPYRDTCYENLRNTRHSKSRNKYKGRYLR